MPSDRTAIVLSAPLKVADSARCLLYDDDTRKGAPGCRARGLYTLKRLDWDANALITGNEKYVVTDYTAKRFLWGYFKRRQKCRLFLSLFFVAFA